MKTFQLLTGSFIGLVVAFMASAAWASPLLLVPAGAQWKYLANGVDPGTPWREAAFNDSTWAAGPAQLGYGDGDEVTVISSGPTNRPVTVYFRHVFASPLPGATSLALRLLRDDGAVVYINGVEVFRSNMPPGPVGYNTLATVAVGGPEETTQFVSASIDPNVLVAGANVVAVEVHQVAFTSSDLSFDLELVADGGPEMPMVTVTAIDPEAAEVSPLVDAPLNPGIFRITRDGPTDAALQISYALIGTAGNGVDYEALSGVVEMPAGAGSVDVVVDVIYDTIAEGDETVALRLASPACIAIVPPPPGCYRVGSPDAAVVIIRDSSIPDPGTNVTLVATGSAWKYLDNGSDQGTAWRQMGFNDSTWALGPAQLGYGDGDEATVVGFGPDPANKFITTYFRRSFDVVNAASFSELRGRLLQDDGAAVYLNGVEVFRSNLPPGPVAFNTLATAVPPDNQIVEFQASPAVLVEGANVVAVEMHQNTVVSSDLSFDLELIGTGGPQPPELPVVNVIASDPDAAESGVLAAIFPGTFTFSRSGPTSNALTVSFILMGSAENGIDYRYVSNQVRFNPNQAQARVDIFPLNDNLVEGTEIVRISMPPPPPCVSNVPPVACYRVGPSNSAQIAIRDANAPENARPHVQLNEPREGEVFKAPTNIILRAYAQDQEDGYQVSVEFFDGNNSLGFGEFVPTLCPAPYCPFYQLTWFNAPPGSHTLTARATDSSGASSNSAPVSITVLPDDSGSDVTLVANGSVWKYLDNGSDQGTAWQQVGFNDSAWALGPAQLGYGDGDEATVVGFGPDPMNKYITTYFRRSFNVVNAASFSALRGRLLLDDGAVVYLNGVEVSRSNLPPGPIAYNTLASAIVGDNQVIDFHASGNFLVEGANVVAVEMHQNMVTSSDLSFDLELIGTGGPQPPELPVVNVVATDSDAAESGLLAAIFPGRFTFYRIPASSNALTVSFVLGGSAGNGLDYRYVSNQVRFNPNQAEARVDVIPQNDGLVEGTETVVLTLLEPLCPAIFPPHPGCYRVGPSNHAEVFIKDADRPPDPGTNVTLVAMGAVWKYLDNGSDQGAAWRQVGFNDSIWALGPAQLGYGDGDEATVVGFGPDPANKYITTYFRRTFNVVNAASFSALRGRLLQDDGTAVYLNGAEVFRSNLPPGPLSFDTLAPVASAENQVVDFQTPSGLLVEGANVVAVEMHQNFPASTDISFDLELVGVRGPQLPTNQLPRVVITRPQDGAVFEPSTDVLIEATTTDPDGYASTVEFFANEQKIGEASVVFIQPPDPGQPIHFEFTWSDVPSGQHRLTARTVDDRGARGVSERVNITVGDTPADDRELHVVGIHTGSGLDGRESQNNGHAAVTVNRPGKRVTLFMSAYWPVTWHVTVGQGTILEKVILAGYYPQTIQGIGANVEIVREWVRYLIGYSLESGQFYRIAPRVRRLAGLEIVSFHGSSTAPYPSPFVIDAVQADPRLHSSYPVPTPLSELPDLRFNVSFYSGGLQTIPYSLGGPVDGGQLLPGSRAVPDSNQKYYYVLGGGGILQIDSTTGTVRDIPLDPNLPDVSWAMGLAYDSLRDRVLLVTLGGEGFLYAYSPSQDRWSVVSSMNNLDFASLVYHAAEDALYGLAVSHSEASFMTLYRLNPNGGGATERQLPLYPWGVHMNTSELVSVGDHLVLLLNPSNFIGDPNREDEESRMYLINPTTGEAWLTARQKRSTQPNQPPEVSITAPAEGAVFPAPASVRITAVAIDYDNYASKVEFFANALKIGEAMIPPETGGNTFNFIWQNVSAGSYALTAKATDLRGGVGISPEVHITVGTNTPPACRCDAPWQNHGEYVSCVIRHAWALYRAGQISRDQRRDLIRDAVRSDCGKRPPKREPVCLHLFPLTRQECHREGVQFVLTGDHAGLCVLECSEDLINWTPLDAVEVDGLEVSCPIEPGAKARFYRIRVVE